MLYSLAQDIVDWNIFAGKKKDVYSSDDIQKQRDLCKAEFQELLDEISFDAVYSPKISNNLKAEVADLFVTSVFLEFMINGTITNWDRDVSSDGDISDLISAIDEFMVHNRPELCLDLVWNLVFILKAEKHLEAVCKSNWTKIPKLDEYMDEPLPTNKEGAKEFFVRSREKAQHEVIDISAANKGRYSGVRHEIQTVVGKGTRIVFKDNKDKVLKPHTFKSYEEFL